MTDKNDMKKPGIRQKKNGKLWLLAAVGVLGLLLLLLGGGLFDGRGEQDKNAAVKTAGNLSEYAERLEASIAGLVSRVGGVSDVTVAVTLERGFEYVYAADSHSEAGQSGSESETKYITVGNGSSEGTVYITEKLPVIGGIGIVCRGGSDPTVQRKLLALISAAYNVGTNKIYITGT